MIDRLIFDFKSDITSILIPNHLNNPFGTAIPDIARQAALEFQNFIAQEAPLWKYDFRVRPGKMFGIVVVENGNGSYGYLGTVSGKLPGDEDYDRFVPSLFDEATDDYFLTKGLTEVTAIGNRIKAAKSKDEIASLTEQRSQLSKRIQQRLFESYHFLNLSGQTKNLLAIFHDSTHGNPPAATGECAAPKLLQYAIKHDLRPIAIAEFWWGNSLNNDDRKHAAFYPACKSKCRPILEYMLDDKMLYADRLA